MGRGKRKEIHEDVDFEQSLCLQNRQFGKLSACIQWVDDDPITFRKVKMNRILYEEAEFEKPADLIDKIFQIHYPTTKDLTYRGKVMGVGGKVEVSEMVAEFTSKMEKEKKLEKKKQKLAEEEKQKTEKVQRTTQPKKSKRKVNAQVEELASKLPKQNLAQDANEQRRRREIAAVLVKSSTAASSSGIESVPQNDRTYSQESGFGDEEQNVFNITHVQRACNEFGLDLPPQNDNFYETSDQVHDGLENSFHQTNSGTLAGGQSMHNLKSGEHNDKEEDHTLISAGTSNHDNNLGESSHTVSTAPVHDPISAGSSIRNEDDHTEEVPVSTSLLPSPASAPVSVESLLAKISELENNLRKETRKRYHLQSKINSEAKVATPPSGAPNERPKVRLSRKSDLDVDQATLEDILNAYIDSPGSFLRKLMYRGNFFTLEQIADLSLTGQKYRDAPQRPALADNETFQVLKKYTIRKCRVKGDARKERELKDSMRNICTDARKTLAKRAGQAQD